jgi:DNA-binding NarL/FixJ family response regulator
MNSEIGLMHKVWDGLVIVNRQSTKMPQMNFDDIISSIFSAGPFYFYIIDFYNMGISNISSGFEAAHGVKPNLVTNINDVLALVHPDDMDFVARAEKKAFDFIYNSLGVDKITRYKISYNFRFKTAKGDYKMYNHQSLILTVDDNGNFIKSLNIHTDISHISSKNNERVSLIGLAGEPSYLNMRVFDSLDRKQDSDSEHKFSNREIEIIRLLAKGLDAKSISDKLFISESTVKTHRKNIRAKSGCKNTLELIAKSTSEGWI